MTRKVLSARVIEIRRLNDELRQIHKGGRVLLSAGIAALSQLEIAAILTAVAAFDAFTTDSDPHGEHDCALFDWQEHRIMFKIDYYDLSLQYHSDDPADPKITTRVMTVMFASEY